MAIIPQEEYDPLQVLVTTPPDVEPITADEVKEYARIDSTYEDTLLETFITAVREAAELYLGRKLITQTLRAVMNNWSDTKVQLPYPPLQSIVKVFTRDEDDVETTYASSNYYCVIESIPGLLVIRDGCSYPENTARYTAGYGIDYIAGYGDAASNVPGPIKQALKLWVAAVYEGRATLTEPSPDARQFLDLFRVERLY